MLEGICQANAMPSPANMIAAIPNTQRIISGFAIRCERPKERPKLRRPAHIPAPVAFRLLTDRAAEDRRKKNQHWPVTSGLTAPLAGNNPPVRPLTRGLRGVPMTRKRTLL